MATERGSSREDAAFLAEILASPDDDTPRLIWADWLEERGDPRAAFVRAQCAAAKLPTWDVERRVLELTAQQYWRVHHLQWLAALPKLEGAKWLPFERGLPAGIEIHSGPHAVAAARAFAEWPLDLLKVGWFLRWDINLEIEDAGLNRAPWLSRIRRLEVANGGLGPALLTHVPSGQLQALAALLGDGFTAPQLHVEAERFQLDSLSLAHLPAGGLTGIGGQQRLRRLAVSGALNGTDLRS